MRVAGSTPGFGNTVEDQFGLLRNLAEDLKLPLTHVVALADDGEAIQKTAISAVNLIDSYILCNQLSSGQYSLNIEPISLKPLFNDVANNLYPLAKEQGFKLMNLVPKKSLLVLSDRIVLESLLRSLGYSFIYAKNDEEKVIKFTATNNQNSVSAGVFSGSKINKPKLSSARKLYGRASVLTSDLGFGTSSGIAIADTLSGLMDLKLTAAKSNLKNGLQVDLLPSKQLSFL